MMQSGILIKSTSFNDEPYWVVKCDNPEINGNINGELPIDPLSFNFHPWAHLEGRKVFFELVEIGENPILRYYASLRKRLINKVILMKMI